MLYLKNNFTKDKTYLAPIAVEILINLTGLLRLERKAGIAFSKMRKPFASNKKSPALLPNSFRLVCLCIIILGLLELDFHLPHYRYIERNF